MKEERGGKTSGTDDQYYLHDNTQAYREKAVLYGLSCPSTSFTADCPRGSVTSS